MTYYKIRYNKGIRVVWIIKNTPSAQHTERKIRRVNKIIKRG